MFLRVADSVNLGSKRFDFIGAAISGWMILIVDDDYSKLGVGDQGLLGGCG